MSLSAGTWMHVLHVDDKAFSGIEMGEKVFALIHSA